MPADSYYLRLVHLLLGVSVTYALSSILPTSGAAAIDAPYTLTPIAGRPYSGGATSAVGTSAFLSPGLTADNTAPADTKGQALQVISRFQSTLGRAGQTLSDVGFVRAYLAPGSDGKIDYAGWDAAWSESFKGDVKPARSTVGVPSLGSPTTLVQLEFVTLAVAGAAQPAEGVGQLPAGRAHFFSAGTLAPTLKAMAGAGETRDKGDTASQARGALRRLQENLASAGLSFKDVAYVRAFIGPDTHQGGRFDYEGWNQAYAEFFPSSAAPARATVTTPTFGDPSTLIEIEIVATFPTASSGGLAVATTSQLLAYGPSTAPIASAVAVRADVPLYFSAGAVAGGDTVEAQALAALELLQSRMAEQGLGLADIALLRAYIVPDAEGNLDRNGWSAAWSRYFGTVAQPGKPARTTIAVHSLPRPEMKIEIDVVAAKKP